MGHKHNTCKCCGGLWECTPQWVDKIRSKTNDGRKNLQTTQTNNGEGWKCIPHSDSVHRQIHKIHSCPAYNLQVTNTNNSKLYWKRDKRLGRWTAQKQHGDIKLVEINNNPDTYDEFTTLYFNNKRDINKKKFIDTTEKIENIDPKTNDLQLTHPSKKKHKNTSFTPKLKIYINPKIKQQSKMPIEWNTLPYKRTNHRYQIKDTRATITHKTKKHTHIYTKTSK